MAPRERAAGAVLFVAAGLLAKASVEPSLFLWFGAALAVYASAWLFRPQDAAAFVTPLSAPLLAYAAWLVATNLWVNPYSAAAPYDASFLLGGFLVGLRAGRAQRALVFKVALAFAALLAAWSLAQLVTGHAARGVAIFETPSTLAATLNIVLVAGLVVVLAGKRDSALVAALALLAAGVAGTQSRGGWLALAVGGCFAFVLSRRARSGSERKWTVAVALLALAAAGLAIATWPTAAGSGAVRLDLYQAALRAMGESSWLTGSGYLDFRYVLQAARPSIPGYREGTTDFVHDDYLQALLESGVPGAAFLVLMALSPAVAAWRRLPRAAAGERTAIIALAAAMSSMAVHALVDFPFYIALCLAMYGACVGMLSAHLAGGRASPVDGRLRQVLRGTVAAAILLVLLKPVVAEAAAAYARVQWEAGRGESAGYWFELARRIEPRDWRYHAYAGEFWFVQAQSRANGPAARLADRIFQEGVAADPREVTNLLWRISTQVYLRPFLAQPADAATLRAWVERASALAPLDARVKFHRYLVERFEAQPAR